MLTRIRDILQLFKILWILIFLNSMAASALSQQLHDSLLADRDGNNYSVKLLLDGNLWMTTNLKLRIDDSYCYENSEENCKRYGRLYTFRSAQKGCSLLGKGWRLPTSDEWKQLVWLYAPGTEDSSEARKKAYHSLLLNGSSSFNALLGGGRDQSGEYARKDAHGFFWTSTEPDRNTACFANFAKGSQALYIQNEGEKERAFSVRCVKSDDR